MIPLSEPQDYAATIRYRLSAIVREEDEVRALERSLQAARHRMLRQAREVVRIVKLSESGKWTESQCDAVFGARLDEVEHAAFLVWQEDDR